MAILSILAFASACATRSSTSSPRAGAVEPVASNAAAARTAFAVLDRRDFETFEALHRKDFVKHYNGGPAESLAEEMRDARGQFAFSSDLRFTVDWVVAEADRVAVAFTCRGTFDGPFHGMAPTGKSYVLQAMTVWRFVDGHIAEEWVFSDDLELYRQVGLLAGMP